MLKVTIKNVDHLVTLPIGYIKLLKTYKGKGKYQGLYEVSECISLNRKIVDNYIKLFKLLLCL